MVEDVPWLWLRFRAGTGVEPQELLDLLSQLVAVTNLVEIRAPLRLREIQRSVDHATQPLVALDRSQLARVRQYASG